MPRLLLCCCWEMPPSAGCAVALQRRASSQFWRFAASSEQFQTPSYVVNHLLLTHDGQDGTGTRLDLPNDKRRLEYSIKNYTTISRQTHFCKTITWVSPASWTR